MFKLDYSTSTNKNEATRQVDRTRKVYGKAKTQQPCPQRRSRPPGQSHKRPRRASGSLQRTMRRMCQTWHPWRCCKGRGVNITNGQSKICPPKNLRAWPPKFRLALPLALREAEFVHAGFQRRARAIAQIVRHGVYASVTAERYQTLSQDHPGNPEEQSRHPGLRQQPFCWSSSMSGLLALCHGAVTLAIRKAKTGQLKQDLGCNAELEVLHRHARQGITAALFLQELHRYNSRSAITSCR